MSVTKGYQKKWSKELCKIHGRLPKENIFQNKNIGPTNLVLQHLNTPWEAFELVFKRDFIEVILVNTNAKYEKLYCQIH